MTLPRLTTLRRLHIAHLLFGMMFWYGIEQLFLNKYLGTNSARGIISAVFTASVLVFDIPCGILADRFGRKRALLLGVVAQTIGLVVMGSSSSLWQYLVGTMLFGLFFGLLNGAAQALLYDHLKQQQLAETYAQRQGSVYAMFLVGAAVANVASGFIGHHLGLRAPYFLSLVPSVLSLLLLLPIAEPPFTQAAAKWYVQFGQALREIKTHPRIIVFGIQFMASGLILLTVGEFGQIYILSFHVSTITLGLLWSAVAGAAALGRLYAHRMQQWPRAGVLMYCAALSIFALLHSWVGIVVFLLVYGYNEALANVSETEVQDEASSEIRATLFSVVNFVGNAVTVPVIFGFNYVYTQHSIFAANAAIIALVIAILFVTVLVANRIPKKRMLEDSTP